MAKDRLLLGTARGWAVKPADENHTAVVFVVGNKKVGALLENDDLANSSAA